MIKSVFITKIQLYNYRNYEDIKVIFNKKISLLIGDNATGKTNFLESLSLIGESRGFRNVHFNNLTNHSIKDSPYKGWIIFINLTVNNCEYHTIRLSINQNSNDSSYSHKKIISIDNKKQSTAKEMYKLCPIISIIPNDYQWLNSSNSKKLKYLDKVSENIFSDHNQLLKKIDHYQSERINLLTQRSYTWLDLIEKKLAELSVAVTSNRINTIHKINSIIEKSDSYLPKFKFIINGTISNKLNNNTPSLLVEEDIQTSYKSSRIDDLYKQKFNTIVNLEKISIISLSKEIQAEFLSNSEQKLLMISIKMTESKLIERYQEKKPIFLIDELSSHLDKVNYKLLLKEIIESNNQVFSSDTHIPEELLEYSKKYCCEYRIKNNEVITK